MVLLADVEGETRVLLVQRRWSPFEGRWALPGGLVEPGEDVKAAARRELAEETCVPVPVGSLELVGVYSAPGRAPRGRYVTFAFTARLPDPVRPSAGSDARGASWMPIVRAVASPGLAFDHAAILTDALTVSAAVGAGPEATP